MKYNYIILLIYFASCGNENNFEPMGIDVFKFKRKLEIPLNSNTLAYSANIHYNNSLIMIMNDKFNTLSFVDLQGNLENYIDLKNKIEITGALFSNLDSVFVYSESSKQIYLVNKLSKIYDSFSISHIDDWSNPDTYSSPQISSTQIPLITSNKSIYLNSLNIGEDLIKTQPERNRYVISNYVSGKLFNYVNFPEEYKDKNWGGMNFRMIYNCNVVDSLIYINFPASSKITIFNTKTKSTEYKEIYPNLKNIILPLNESISPFLNKNEKQVTKHFYRQYSFRGIMYDKYRKLFYRILLQPTSNKNFEKKHYGTKNFYMVVYDEYLNYIGFHEFDESYSSFTYFVNEEGLFIQKLNRDEKSMHFDVFNFNDNFQ